MFKTNFSGHNKKAGGAQKIWVALPLNAPSGYGPGLNSKIEM